MSEKLRCLGGRQGTGSISEAVPCCTAADHPRLVEVQEGHAVGPRGHRRKHEVEEPFEPVVRPKSM